MIAQRGRVERAEMEKTFNMGVGMVAVVAPEDTDRALAVLTARHLACWTLGTIKKGSRDVRAPAWWASTPGSESARRRQSSSSAAPFVGHPVGAVEIVRTIRTLRQLALKPLKSVCGELYLSSRATLVCFAFARPRPMGEPPRAITERPNF